MLFTKGVFSVALLGFAATAVATDCYTQDCPAGMICPIQAGEPGPFQCTPAQRTKRTSCDGGNECFVQEDCAGGQICPIQAGEPGPFQCQPAQRRIRTAACDGGNQCYVQEDCPAGMICPIQAGEPGPFQCTPEQR